MPRTGCGVQGITERRKQAGLSVTQLAVCIGISHSHLEKIEAGTFRPSIEVAHRIARAVHCQPADILADSKILTSAKTPVRLYRWRSGLYLSEAAVKADVTVAHLCNVEAGRKPGSADLLSRLAAAYGCEASDLTGAAA